MVENKVLLEMDMQRNVLKGSVEELAEGIRKAGDLRIYTEFRHNEHIDPSSDNHGVQCSRNRREVQRYRKGNGR